MQPIRFLAVLLALVLLGCSGNGPVTPVAVDEVVTFTGALSNKLAKADSSAQLMGRLHVGTRLPTASKRILVNVALVIDTSGSMEGKAIEDAKAASLAMVDGLADGDWLSVIAFGSKSDVLIQPTELDDDTRDDAKKKLQAMKAEGTTDMASGLRSGLNAVRSHLDVEGINRIVLLGDGVPNNEAEIEPLAQQARDSGISITSLGLGIEYNETLMGKVAQISGGRFHYVDDSSKVAAFFQKEVLRLQGVYAKNAAVELTPGPGVTVGDVIGQRVIPVGGGKVRVELGDLSRDESRDLFVRLTASPHRDGAPIELCDAVLTYDIPAGARVERRVFLGAHATASDEKLAESRDSSIEQAAMLAQAAAATLQAIELAKAGQPDQARGLLARVAAELDDVAKRTGNNELKEKAAALRALGGDLPLPERPTAKKPKSFNFEDDALEGSMPAPAAAPSPAQARKIRSAHDEAMQRLQ